jgi:hypothetical protein
MHRARSKDFETADARLAPAREKGRPGDRAVVDLHDAREPRAPCVEVRIITT